MPARITIVDYQMGNLRSVQKAVERIGGQATISSDPDVIAGADKLILPGVGAFGDAMRELAQRGLVEAIHRFVATERPFFGICLGLQLLFDVGYEGEKQTGLGIIPGEVVRFQLPKGMKVPHMGWNRVNQLGDVDPLMSNMEPNPFFYFVHSFYAVPKNKTDVWLESDYGLPFCAAVRRNNIHATQFHPEKSQRDGLQLLKNFAEL